MPPKGRAGAIILHALGGFFAGLPRRRRARFLFASFGVGTPRSAAVPTTWLGDGASVVGTLDELARKEKRLTSCSVPSSRRTRTGTRLGADPVTEEVSEAATSIF